MSQWDVYGDRLRKVERHAVEKKEDGGDRGGGVPAGASVKASPSGRGPGRPRGVGTGRVAPLDEGVRKLTVRVSREEYRSLRIIALMRDDNVSSIIRSMVSDFVRRNKVSLPG